MRHFERLEHRTLFSANNVSVTVDASFNARLIGDDKDNDITVTLAPGIGYYVIGQHGTLINGKPAVAIQTTAALHFDVKTGNGKDRVTFAGVFATQSLNIDTGNGDDVVTLSQTNHLGNVVIATGNGNDSVVLSAIQMTGDLNIDTGNGDDLVTLSQTSHLGNVGITTGNGNDSIVLSAIHLTGDLNVTTGNGEDAVTVPNAIQIDGNSTINGGNGKNQLAGQSLMNVSGANAVLNAAPQPQKKLKKSHPSDD